MLICNSLVLLLGGNGQHVDIRVTGAVLELDGAVNQCVQRVITTHAHVQTRAMDGAALAADDVTGLCKLTPKILTPRRLLSLSRPFFELPTPFLCAIIE